MAGYNEPDYTTENWVALTAAKEDGDAAIEAADTIADVGTAKDSALLAMAAVPTIAQQDQSDVDEAIALVNSPIASLVAAGGPAAGAEQKRAAVQAYVESLEGIAHLGVTVAVGDGSDTGTYKITITKGATASAVKDNVQVTAFVYPPDETPYTVKHYQQDVSGDGYSIVKTEQIIGVTGATATAAPQPYTGFEVNENSSTMEGIITGDGGLVLVLYYDRETFTVTFNSNGGSPVASVTGVRYGTTIDAPADPTKDGYEFNGWYKEAALFDMWDFTNDMVTANISLYARWTDSALGDFRCFIDEHSQRTRPGYTDSIGEWNTYWGQFQTALSEAEDVYEDLEGEESLTPEQTDALSTARTNLQREVEILDGIEDFDSAWGGRDNPLGLVETVYARSLVSDGFQHGRLRCYYEKGESNLYWLLSGFLQGQGYYPGTTGTGMSGGLQNVMMSAALVRMQSCGRAIDIYKSDGTRKTEDELESEGINLALQWISSDRERFKTSDYIDFVGFEVDAQLVGMTSEGTGKTEFARTYTFEFVDAGVHLFESYFRYCVEDDTVQRLFGDYNIINATKDEGYIDSTIQGAIEEASPGDEIYVANGIFDESVTIDKSITLIGNHMSGPTYPTVIEGSDLGNVPGIKIENGVSDVTITGFEIANFQDGGIAAQGAGIDNVTIERNFIHDVGAEGIRGSAGGTQALSNWSVSHNTIEGYSESGINLVNVAVSAISENKITGSGSGSGAAINVTGKSDAGSVTVAGITVAGNEVTGDDVRVAAAGTGSGAATTQNITISGNVVTAGAISVLADAEGASSATAKDITIDGNAISGDSVGIDLGKQGGGGLQNFTISGNNLTINSPMANGAAVKLADVGGESIFTKNGIVFTGTAGSGVVFDGVDISGNGTGEWIILSNELDGGGVGGSGIRLSSLPGAANVYMTRTKVTGWVQGIKSDTLATGTEVEFRQNWIEGNTSYGIQNGSDETIDATLNYWGETSGPRHATSNPDGQGNAVSDNVNYSPWHQDEEFVSYSDGTVHNETQDNYYNSITIAINEANPYDTIKVAAGTYSERLMIDKPLHLIGDPGEENVPGPGPNAPIIDGEFTQQTATINVKDTSGVIIEGFEIKNSDRGGIEPRSSGADDVIIRYNYIHQVQEGFRMNGGEGWVISHNVIQDCNNAIFVLLPIKDVSITDNYLASSNIAIDGLGKVNGTGIISGNNITMVGSTPYGGMVMVGDGTAEWIINDNVLNGNGNGSYGFLCYGLSNPQKIEMNRNTVIGWKQGVRLYFVDNIDITLRSNLIYDNSTIGVQSDNVSSHVDAKYNYWGYESGPLHDSNNPNGQGNKVDGYVSFDPWYIDIDCTTTNDQDAMDQEHVDAAIALVPGTIATVIVSGGGEATAEAKMAAVKEHIENLEGMAALGVTVTVAEGTESGYKITITKGKANPGIKDNVQVTEFVVPPADQEAAQAVTRKIQSLPWDWQLELASFIDHLAAIEEAEAAYEALTEPQKALINPYVVGMLNDIVAKAEALVLEELDGRIDSAIEDLNLEFTGIGEVLFEERKATLVVSDPDKKVHEFVLSGVLSLFQSMFQDVVEMKLGNDPTWYGVDGTSAQGVMEAGAHIVSVLLDLDYEYGEDYGGVFSELAAANLGQLIGKSLSIEVKIERLEGGKQYTGTYEIEFAAQ